LNKLHNVLLNRAKSKDRFQSMLNSIGGGRFEIKNANSDEATVYLYDVIVSDEASAEWFGGVAPQPFVQALSQVTAKKINLRINSPGGDVFGARAIEQALREHPAEIVAHIDGYAASAATIVMMAADQIIMNQGAMLMIHDAWSLVMGNSSDMIDTAALLEKIDGTIATTYANRTGLKVEDVRALMDAETWFTAEEAVTAKFADSVSDSKQNQQNSAQAHVEALRRRTQLL
jgi:ATP-dependent Clp protease, protease subunit